MSDMVEVKIDSIRISLMSQQRIVMLREPGRERYLPIWIGPFEAEAITISLQEVELARPQTHDLLLQSFTALGARLIRVEILDLKQEVFFANLVVEVDGKIHDIDARPSDSIALAVRAHIPIMVNTRVLHDAGITPEEDIQCEVLDGESSKPPTETIEPAEQAEALHRLSIYEDFLQNVNLEDLDDPEDRGENPSSDEDENPPQGYD